MILPIALLRAISSTHPESYIICFFKRIRFHWKSLFQFLIVMAKSHIINFTVGIKIDRDWEVQRDEKHFLSIWINISFVFIFKAVKVMKRVFHVLEAYFSFIIVRLIQIPYVTVMYLLDKRKAAPCGAAFLLYQIWF